MGEDEAKVTWKNPDLNRWEAHRFLTTSSPASADDLLDCSQASCKCTQSMSQDSRKVREDT